MHYYEFNACTNYYVKTQKKTSALITGALSMLATITSATSMLDTQGVIFCVKKYRPEQGKLVR